MNQPPDAADSLLTLYSAAAILDATGLYAAPGAIALQHGRVVAAGPQKILARHFPSAPRIHHPDRLLIPALVNAHAHLDLTHVGPQPYPGNFIDWAQIVIRNRPADPRAVAASVQQGIALSRAAGVLTIGDIAAHPAATLQLARSDLRGVSFAELLGRDLHAAQQTLDRWPAPTPALRTGIQPHAPYSTGPDLYRLAAAAADQRPITTHLAETPDELRFLASADGPFRDFLQQIGKWNPAIAADYPPGRHPVDFLAAIAPSRPWLCAHCNYLDDHHLNTIAQHAWSVVYCPRASHYFGHRHHRYRDLIAAGVNLCLGTDSIICHSSLSILDEMRFLHRRDALDGPTLLRLATTNAMRALGLDPRDATFSPGARPGILALPYHGGSAHDPLAAALAHDAPIDLLVLADLAGRSPALAGDLP